MPITAYITATSGPCRVVRLVAAAINLELNLIPIDLAQPELADPNFIKVNPQRTIPTIVDKGFSLMEQNTIARYFINKYAPDSPLYSKDPKIRAIIDQRLDFNLGTFYPRFGSYFFPILSSGDTTAAATEKLEEALGYLNIFLVDSPYVASGELTIADLAIAVTVSNVQAVGVDMNKYKEILRWFEDVKANAPGFEDINREANEELEMVQEELKMRFGGDNDSDTEVVGKSFATRASFD